MYNNAIFMEKLINGGWGALTSLNKTDKAKIKCNGDNVVEEYNNICNFLGFDTVFNVDKSKTALSLLEYFVSNAVPLSDEEIAIYEILTEGFEDEAKGFKILKGDKLVLSGVDITSSIRGKMRLMIRSLMEIIERDVSCYNIFAEYGAGKVTPENLTKRIHKYLVENVKIIIKDTNIAYKVRGNMVELYLPENDAGPIQLGEYEYIEQLIYSEMADSTDDKITYTMRLSIINYLNNNNIFSINKKDPLLLLQLEYYRRITGCSSIAELLKHSIYLGKVVDLAPQIGSTCYAGNIDETITIWVKSVEAQIEKKFLYRLTEDKSLTLYASRGLIEVKSDKNDKRISLWEFLMGNKDIPKSNPNQVLESNMNI